MAAIGLALVAAAGVAIPERRISSHDRRSDVPQELPLAPKVVMRRTRGVDAGPVTVTVLIPAHNEEASIRETIRSLQTCGTPASDVVPTGRSTRPPRNAPPPELRLACCPPCTSGGWP